MKTKTLISFPVTAKLICVFVFAYADYEFSHDLAQSSDFVLYFDSIYWRQGGVAMVM